MLRVLIADDESVIRNGIAHLIKASGLDLTVAALAQDGEEAVEAVCRLDPEIIIMDINMPRLNGLQAIRKIRALSPDAKIIILSGYSDFSYAQQAIDLGVFKYLLKPLDFRSFSGILSQAMEAATKRLWEKSRLPHEEPAPARDKSVAALQYIREHFTDNTLTLSGVAQKFYLSPSYLTKIIKEKTSLSFTDYLNRLRIDLAEKLLSEEPEMTVNEIAERSGYSSQHYFSRAFKNYTGLSPMQYRSGKDSKS